MKSVTHLLDEYSILRLKQGARKLNPLNLPSKFGVWLLALLLFGLPLLNCVTPAQAMTTAEKDCCKKMAGECGRAGMAKSHSCCQSSSSLDTRPLAKVASPTIPHFTLAMTDVIPQAVILVSAHAFLNPWVMQFHSPPAETPPDNTVLRI